MKYLAFALTTLLTMQSTYASVPEWVPGDGDVVGVPAPATIGLLAIGIGALAVSRYFKK